MRSKKRGFTLVELLVVLGILSILGAMSWPLANLAVQRERERDLKHAVQQIRDALDAYKAARVSGAIPGSEGASLYPPSLEALTQTVVDARPATRGQVLRFLRRIPRDPFASPGIPSAQTWGLRSFVSEADKPLPGTDVYDVYSLSTGTALNGTALKDL